MRVFSDAERLSTAAALGGVWIGELEPAAHEAVLEVHNGAVEVQEALGIAHDLYAVDLAQLVGGVLVVIETQRVAEAGAAASFDADAQAGALGQALLFDDTLDFRDGPF